MSKKFAVTGLLAAATLALASCGANASTQADASAGPAEGASTEVYEMLPEGVRADGEIVVGTAANTSPFVFKAGNELDGMLVDLGQELSMVMGVDITWSDMAFPGLMPALQAEKVDVVWSLLTATEEREQAGDMLAFMKNSSGFMTMAGSDVSIDARADLCGLRLSTVRGGTTQAYFEDTVEWCAAEGHAAPSVAYFDDRDAAQAQMRSGKLDAFSGITVPLRYVADQVDGGTMFSVQKFQYGAGANAMMIPKDQQELTAALQAGLQEVVASGRYEEIMAEYRAEPEVLTPEQVVVNPATSGELDEATRLEGQDG